MITLHRNVRINLDIRRLAVGKSVMQSLSTVYGNKRVISSGLDWQWGTEGHRCTGQFFFSRTSHLWPKIFLIAPENSCYANLQNCFARLTAPSIISKNPGFRALYLARENRFFFNKHNFFHFWLLASDRKISICPKNNGFARVLGLQPQVPWLVRLWWGLDLRREDRQNKKGFEIWCFRRLLRVSWTDHWTNEWF